MRQRKKLLYLLLAGSGASVLSMSCADYLTGQLEEPAGPLEITKLTLFDGTSRDVKIFTDTSVPDCSAAKSLDCSAPENVATNLCRTCYNSVDKDVYSPLRSVPTPDSIDLRVVTNKTPQTLDGVELSDATAIGKAVGLKCASCAGVPVLKKTLLVSGSGISFDPKQIPYGPSLQLTVDTTDPRSALEPDSSYEVTVDPGVAGRDGQRVNLAAAASLLSFKTEPFKVLKVGRNDSSDKWVYASDAAGQGTAASPYKIADVPLDGAVVLKVNAPLHADTLKALKFDGLINAGVIKVDVKVGTNVFKVKDSKCQQDDQRYIYLYPDTPDRRWPLVANEITVQLKAGSIKDVAQSSGYPVGKHVLSDDILVSIKLTGQPADKNYKGLTLDAARYAGDCMPLTKLAPNVAMPGLNHPAEM